MNQDPNNNRPQDDDELRQTLLELHYGLLEDDEAAELKRRIETEPQMAQRWAETLSMAGRFAEAAKAPVNATPLSPSIDVSSTQPKTESQPDAGPAPRRFNQIWLCSLATAATIAFVICGLRYWNRMPSAPDANLRIAVKPMVGAESDARNEFLVVVGPGSDEPDADVMLPGNTFDGSMPIVPATISYRVLSEGAVLFFGETETASSGPTTIRVPDDVAIPEGALLHVDAEPTDGKKAIRLTVPLEPTRCLTFLSTDRPVYRPGETVYFRSVTLNRRTLAAHLEVPIRYELTDPSGATVEAAIAEGVTERGVGNGAFVIPESSPGGPYQLIAKSLDGFFPDQSCEIEVRRYRTVRLKTDLEFSKRSFSAGDQVQAELVVRRADDSVPVAAAVRIKAVVDEQVIHESTGVLGLQGELAIRFQLPKVIRQGEGLLTVAINDGAVTETAARPIPIHTGRAEVAFYPEGGYLVGGIQNRVYFAAKDSLGKPIEIAGEVLSQSGRVVATVQTVRDGMGRFEFKPDSGQRYSLRITRPLDITETPWLPSVVEALPVMDTGIGVFDEGEPIKLTIRSTKRRQCILRSVCRGELVGIKTIEIGLGETDVTLPVQDRAAGVIRVTVLDAESEIATPLVERLVYRKSTRRLNIIARAQDERTAHAPGDSVRMTIEVTDEQNQPVAGAVLGVSVVDDAALSLRQKDTPSIKTHFLLTSEIRSPEDLEHADFYLSDSPEASDSLDLLLGTQGWRRFVSGTPEQFDESFRDALTRLLELDGQRAGLIAATQSNDSSNAEQFRHYQLLVTAAWRGFIVEIRWALIVIGALWVVGFVLRPRKSAVAAASVLLVIVVIAVQAGCGASHEARVVGAPERDESASAAEMGDVDLSAPPQNSSSAAAEEESAEEEAPFVERVVRTFLGQGGDRSANDIVHARISTDQLEKWARSRDLDAQTLADQLMEELRFPIRQYAHVRRPSEDGTRNDFTETLYWNPAMVTDSNGTATIRFDLSDSLTLFRVRIDGHSHNGRLGSGGGAVVTKIPIQVEPKVPLEVTGGDRIDLPVGIVNATDQAGQLDLALKLDATLKTNRTSATTSVRAGERSTESFSIDVAESSQPTEATIRLEAEFAGGTMTDRVERTLRIVPDGFPFQVADSGSLSKSVAVSTRLPDTVVPGSLSGRIELYPSTRSQLSAGLESILREPHGCFEQASASNYPNVMAYGLLLLDGQVDDSTRRRTVSLLRRGYRKLTSYECSTLGYEWFGNDPGHEALSAFGLMQFSEMSSFIDVDTEMLDRTRKWLLSRRDGQGGFKRNPRHLHAWSVQQDVVNAYLLWALSNADRASKDAERTERELARELDRLQNVADDSDDPYLIALSAIALGNAGRDAARTNLLDRLQELQKADGSLEGQTTITQSGGISKTVETTALAVLAWSTSPEHRTAATSATDWLTDNRRGGGFGSTQATVLALKAMIAMHNQLVGKAGGNVEVVVDDRVIETIRWQGQPADGVHWQMTPTLVETLASQPDSRLELRADDGASVPFAVRLSGMTTSPKSDPACPIKVRIAFSDDSTTPSVASGNTIEAVATITNSSDQGQPMTVAVVGIPGGLEPVIESMDKLRESGEIDFYELRGREVVLYWRTFAPSEAKRVSIPCVAEVGGKYTGPPSRAYLYYTAESKTWAKPLVVEIQ